MAFGDLLRTSLAMLRARFWGLMGLSLLFVVFQFACAVVMALGAAVFGIAVLGLAGSGADNPDGLFGMGLGSVLFLVASSAVYGAAALGHQAAMVTFAAPSEPAAFGAALARGIRSVPTFFGAVVILTLANLLVGEGLAAVPEMLRVIAELLLVAALLPLAIFFGSRFAVIVPVVAVEQEYGPLAAIRRCWELTHGRVLAIARALIGFVLVAGLVFGAAMVGLILLIAAVADSGRGETAMVLLVIALLLPLAMIAASLTAAFTAVLHDRLTGGRSEALAEIFA